MLVTNPRPDLHHLADYYQSQKYLPHQGKGTGLTAFLYRTARRFTNRWKLSLLDDPGQGNQLLDFGCGSGEFLAAAKHAGWTVTGIESDPAAAKKASALLNKQVMNELGQLRDGLRLDVITLWHVLEHLPEPGQTLRSLRRHLQPHGKLIIAVPNPASFDAHRYKEAWAGFDVPRHLWHFTRDTMERLLLYNGFALQTIHPMKLDAYYVSLLSERTQRSSLPYFKAAFAAFRSNLHAARDGKYSSLTYIAVPC